MATAQTVDREALTRDQVAERVKELLNHTPQSGAALVRLMPTLPGSGTGRSDLVRLALQVLEARGEAKKVGRSGWVAADSPQPAEQVEALVIDFPYEPVARMPVDVMFIDKRYQRPLTSFAEVITRKFNPVLFGTVSLSDRGERVSPLQRYAVMDGQTRWTAVRRLGVSAAPALVFSGLSLADEADIFEQIQSQRRGVTSWYKFRAKLVAKNPAALAIKDIAEAAGYTLGDTAGDMQAVGALQFCYKTNDQLLERTLFILRASFDTDIPGSAHIKGLHTWFRNHKEQFRRKTTEVDDERLVRRLQVTGLNGLEAKAKAAAQMGGKGGGNDIYMARAIDAAYKAGR